MHPHVAIQGSKNHLLVFLLAHSLGTVFGLRRGGQKYQILRVHLEPDDGRSARIARHDIDSTLLGDRPANYTTVHTSREDDLVSPAPADALDGHHVALERHQLFEGHGIEHEQVDAARGCYVRSTVRVLDLLAPLLDHLLVGLECCHAHVVSPQSVLEGHH